MKIIKSTLLVLGAAAMMASCTISHTAIVTNNSVGSKTGVIKSFPFKKDFDLSFEKAMKNGDITKVGIAEMKVKQFLIIPFYNFTVTGE